MQKGVIFIRMFATAVLVVALCGACMTAGQVAVKAEPQKISQSIKAAAEVDNNHPPIEPGFSCVDCHEIKVDAETTATQNWLYAETPGKEANEGVMPEELLLQHVRRVIGGIKMESKTFVLGTSMNNRPLTTTAEFTLDPEKMILYGFHEKGTEKLNHIKTNPYVSLNYHKEFESFDVFLCCQILGTAVLIDGTGPEYERIIIDLLPYEDGARVPESATPQQREEHLKKFRRGIKKGFYISKIAIDRLTMINIDFVKNGYRRVQRWERKR